MKRKDIGQAFKNAKFMLWDGYSTVFDGYSSGPTVFICHAIQDGNQLNHWPGTSDAAMKAISIIEHRLHPYTTVDTWVGANIPGADKYAKNIPREEIQAFRHRWLDSLIKEFS